MPITPFTRIEQHPAFPDDGSAVIEARLYYSGGNQRYSIYARVLDSKFRAVSASFKAAPTYLDALDAALQDTFEQLNEQV